MSGGHGEELGAKMRLVLASGEEFVGRSFGAPTSVAGEVVFNTAMCGYPESLTDPSYRGQILVLTFPLIGNYGVPGDDRDEYGLLKYFESEDIHVAGVVVSSYSGYYSHWNASRSLGAWLREHNIPAITGVDTRAITKALRESGSMLGKILQAGEDVEYRDPNKDNLLAEVSRKEPKTYNAGGYPRIIAYDCGMKNNIIREFLKRQVELTVVPYDFDISQLEQDRFDGVFVSNGPGDPALATPTIENIRKVLEMTRPSPVVEASHPGAAPRPRVHVPFFGICLGNQLLAHAIGAKTYKMKYGNRGVNQPCVDLRTTQCYITSQNHGFAVDNNTLPDGWKPLFMNANDYSNEGIIHLAKPFYSVQFHPEACAGPRDTTFLFDNFIQTIVQDRVNHSLVTPAMYHIQAVRKCVLIGSGGLSIGQAGEFDYSGSQAIKALKEENIEVILINPNIATVQTSKDFADQVYFLPVTPDMVRSVIMKERPDSILVSMGGQTALNVGVALHEDGTLEKYGVRVLGTPIEAVKNTEDREKFAKKLAEVDEYCAMSISAHTVEEACEAAQKIGFPVLVRAAFALGGLGSGFANNKEELIALATKAFASSHQIIIDEDLRGWKEVEYEVLRDCKDNCVTVCNMENFDPLGIHTGDSIVIAPSQTLTDAEYMKLRDTALKVVRHLGVVGECNIQYALHPDSERYCIIEVNARLSRSSALASKATGYPLAYVATKVALGKDLVRVRNSVTQTTTACFEPALDYVVAKVPRWDLTKFQHVSDSLGSSMKSVGEVMAVGRSFEEVLQKAMRMVDPSMPGFTSLPLRKAGGPPCNAGDKDLELLLTRPTPRRLYALARALELDYSVDRLYQLTKIDRWFLSRLENIVQAGRRLDSMKCLFELDASHMRELKQLGYSDRSIADAMRVDEMAVRRRRIYELEVVPVVKQIDTLAAEYPAQTNYLYTTYHGTENDIERAGDGVMVMGNGPYCIGSSVEFDWCAVSCVRTLRRSGMKAIVMNCNPETVSTDYDESDRLYFEELTFERTLDIYEFEKARGVIVSVGGQVPNCMALPLSRQGVRVLGTSASSIDCAEDRNKFSALLDSIKVDQPKWRHCPTWEDADSFANAVGYPVLVRPSYVLSGAAMRVATNRDEIREFLEGAVEVSAEHPVVVSKFILNAKEIEFDAVAKDGRIINYAISEHIENAGVHSGDATLVLPAQKLYVETIRRVLRIAGNITSSLNITGPFNIQFISKNNDVKVIECNLRASRTFPFVSKTLQCDFIDLATRAMIGLPVRPADIKLLDLDYVGVKAPMFSFLRLQGADPTLGVEMASTGEVACYGRDVHEALLLSLLATGFKVPHDNKNVLFTVGSMEVKQSLAGYALTLQRLGYTIFATRGTAEVFKKHGVTVTAVGKPSSDEKPQVLDLLSSSKISFAIDIPSRDRSAAELSNGYRIRRAAIDFGINLITNPKLAMALIDALEQIKEVPCLSAGELFARGAPTGSFDKSTVTLLRQECISHQYTSL